MPLRLTSRIVLSFVLFAAALLATVGILSYRSGRASLQSAAAAEVLAVAVEKAAAVRTALDERMDDVRQMATATDLVGRVAGLIAATPASTEARSLHALVLQELEPYTIGPHAAFVEWFVIAADGGTVLVSTSPSDEGASKAERPYFAGGKTGLHLQGPYYSNHLKAPAMVIAAPVRSADGRLLAVLAARLNLGEVNAGVGRRTGRHQSEDAFLFNDKRLLVTQPRFIRESVVLQRTLEGDIFGDCVAGNAGTVLGPDYRGVAAISACHWMAEYRLGLIVKLDQAEAFASVRTFGRTLAAIGGLALLVSASLALVLARRIVRPVRRLHDGVRRFAEGRFQEPMPESSGDELGLLAREFNAMALVIGTKESELRQLADELEERVRHRTAELARAQEVAQVGSWEWDVVHNTVTWSDQTFRIFGLDRDTWTPSYEQYLACLHPDDRQRAVEWVNAVLTTKAPARLENRIVRPDGDVRIVDGRADVVLDDAGEVIRVVGTTQDITARKKSEEQFQRLLESAPDAMVVVGRDGRIVVVNAQAEALFGYARADLLGQRIEFLVPPRFGGHAAEREAFFASGRPRRMGQMRELYGLRSDGSEVPVEISLSPLETEAGPLVISAIRDVTENKRVEAELRQAKTEAEAANRAKSEFLATMSHEIRTPMNGVIGAVGLLLDGELTPPQRELAAIARSSAHSLLTLINDILDISKIEAGKMPVDRMPFDLLATLEEVGGMFAARAEEKSLELILRYAPDARRRFVGDPSRIRQVLVNLVGNAIKFTERGHVFVSVGEGQAADPQSPATLCFSIEDTGIGVAPAATDRLFERFAQADASTTRRFGGTGLGLAICKRLVELMGGQIGVTSQAGEGSTFWFSLPLMVDTSPALAPARTATELSAARVLLVDDNPVNCRVMHEQMCGWNVRNGSAASGGDALDALRAAAAEGDPYHIALIDCHLSDTDGVGLARTIKADPELRYLTLFLLTSALEKNAEALRRAGGFSGWLAKPVRPSALFDRLITICTGQSGSAEAGAGAPQAVVPEVSPRPRFGGRVLVADDNTTNQRVAQLALEGLGCRVDLAGNGADALAMLRQQAYDLVFMDGEMPEMDGFEAAREIRALEARRAGHGSVAPGWRVPIVAVTAKVLAGDREKCLAAGMDDYLSKPVQLDALIAMLERWLPPQATSDGGAPPAGLDRAALEKLRTLAQATTPALFAQVLEAFRTDAATYLAALQDAAARNDRVSLRRTGHALKGASLNAGATAMAEISRRIETADEAGGGVDVAPLLVQLESEFHAVQAGIAWELDREQVSENTHR